MFARQEKEIGDSQRGMPRGRVGGGASFYPGNGERHKSTILQLFGLTFIVMGQLHLLRSLIIIDRAAMRESFPPSGTCYAASSSFLNYREYRFFYSPRSFSLFLPPLPSEASRFSQTRRRIILKRIFRFRRHSRLHASPHPLAHLSAMLLLASDLAIRECCLAWLLLLALLAAVIPLFLCARHVDIKSIHPPSVSLLQIPRAGFQIAVDHDVSGAKFREGSFRTRKQPN
jgi:hypothetical protein